MICEVLQCAIEYDKGDVRRINHFLKVKEFAVHIAKSEKVDSRLINIVEYAAILHDIGIHESERIYGDVSGKHQEELGPDIARKILLECYVDDDVTDRVCLIISKHHTYSEIYGIDHQIIIEADFLVNFYEDKTSIDGIKSAYEKIFKTESGKALCRLMYNI